MSGLVRAPRDFWLGALYLVLGLAGFWIARNYAMGTAGRMGPGYLPTGLSILLILFGAISLARAFLVAGEPVAQIALRPMALILVSVLAFAVLLKPVGLVGALIAVGLISAVASPHFRLQPLAFLGLLGLVAFCCLLFVYGLGLSMPLVGTLFR
jgi:hypothetical protein